MHNFLVKQKKIDPLHNIQIELEKYYNDKNFNLSEVEYRELESLRREHFNKQEAIKAEANKTFNELNIEYGNKELVLLRSFLNRSGN